MSNTTKILKEIAASEEYKALADAIEQAEYETVCSAYSSILKKIDSGKEMIQKGFENLPPRSRGEHKGKFQQSFYLAVERLLPLWHQLDQALAKSGVMEGEVFGFGKKGDPLVRTPGGSLVALRSTGLEEGSQVKFVVVHEGEKISIGKVFELNPHSFYTLLTQEPRERIKRSLASVEDQLKDRQWYLDEDYFIRIKEILSELDEVREMLSNFNPRERERVIAQVQEYRKRLLYDVSVRLMFDFLSQQEEKAIEDFYRNGNEEKEKALSALGLFRRHTYEAAEKFLQNDNPEEYGQSLDNIDEEIDSMDSAIKLLDFKAAIDRAYPKAKSYLEKMDRLFDRLTKRVWQVTDSLPETGPVEAEEIHQAVKNTFNEDALFIELRKSFRSSSEFFSLRGAFNELNKKLGDQESILAEAAFRAYLDHIIPRAFAARK